MRSRYFNFVMLAWCRYSWYSVPIFSCVSLVNAFYLITHSLNEKHTWYFKWRHLFIGNMYNLLVLLHNFIFWFLWMLCDLKVECAKQAQNKAIQYLAQTKAVQYYIKYSVVTFKLAVSIVIGLKVLVRVQKYF
jgi:hypothetical protein